MSDEQRRVSFTPWTYLNLSIWFLGFMVVLSGIRGSLDRIATALERAHPASEASK